MHRKYAGIAEVQGVHIVIKQGTCLLPSHPESAVIARGMDVSIVDIQDGMIFSGIRILNYPPVDDEWNRHDHCLYWRDDMDASTHIKCRLFIMAEEKNLYRTDVYLRRGVIFGVSNHENEAAPSAPSLIPFPGTHPL